MVLFIQVAQEYYVWIRRPPMTAILRTVPVGSLLHIVHSSVDRWKVVLYAELQLMLERMK